MVIVIINGCAQFKQVVQQPKPKKEIKILKDKPIPFKESYFQKIISDNPSLFYQKLKDSTSFYNSTEIVLEGEFFKQSISFEDRKISLVDNITDVRKIVPQFTPGGIIEIKFISTGKMKAVKVSFSKNEATYEFYFFRVNDGRFILSGNATLIFNGRKYPVTATATTSEDCFLLFYLNYKKNKIEIREEAKGWVEEGWKEY